MKKTLALVLSLVMLFAMGAVGASAEGEVVNVMYGGGTPESFGRGVVRLARVAHQPGDGSDVDDPPRALAHEVRREHADGVERAHQVHAHHGGKILAGHAHNQLIARDARVVYKNVDGAERFFRRVDGGFHLGIFAHVRARAKSLRAQRARRFDGFLRGGLVARV